MKKIYIIILFFYISSCNYKPLVGAPWNMELMMQGPDAPMAFKKGWRDGCETGISITANVFQKHYYTFTQDPNMSQDRVYYSGWKTAYLYCSRYIFQYLRRNII